jgi:hypothetical protein
MNKPLALLLSFLLIITSTLNAQHYKKDGTPDRRYHENRSGTYRTSRTSTHYSPYTSTYTPISRYKRSDYNYSVPRDTRGRIKRDPNARYSFMKQTGYPHGRPGYVIDHIKPLKKGGCDCPSNMQWQTKAAAKAKDRWE